MIRAALCLLLIGTAAAAVTVDVGAAAVGNEWRPACDAVKDGVVLTNVAANVRAVIEGCTIAVSSSTAAVVSAVAIDGLGAGATVELRGCTITATFTHAPSSPAPTAIHAAVRVLPGAALGAGSALVIDGTSIEVQDRSSGVVGAAVLLDTAVVAGDGFALAVKGGSNLRAECTHTYPCAGIAVIGQTSASPTGRVVFGARTAITVDGSAVHADTQGKQGRAVWFFGATFGEHSVVVVSNSILRGAAEGATASGLEVKNAEFGASTTVSVTASNVTAVAAELVSGVLFSNVRFGDDAVVLLDGCNVTSTTTAGGESWSFALGTEVRFGLRGNVSVFDSSVTATSATYRAAAVYLGAEDGDLTFGDGGVVALKGTRISASVASHYSRGVVVSTVSFGHRCSIVVSECSVSITSSRSPAIAVHLMASYFGQSAQFQLVRSVVSSAKGLVVDDMQLRQRSVFNIADNNVTATDALELHRLFTLAGSRFVFARNIVTAVALSTSATAVRCVFCQFPATSVTFQDSNFSVTGHDARGVMFQAELSAPFTVERCNVTVVSSLMRHGTADGILVLSSVISPANVVTVTGCNVVATAPRSAATLTYRSVGASDLQLVIEDTNLTASTTETDGARAFLLNSCNLGARTTLRITRCNLTSAAAVAGAAALEFHGNHILGEDSVVSIENTSLTARTGGEGASAIQMKNNVIRNGNGTVRIVGCTLASSAVSSAQALRFQESDLVNTSIVIEGSVLQFGASTSSGAPNGAIVSDTSSTWDGVSLALTDTALAASDATTAAAKATFIVWPKTVAGVSPQRLTNVSLAAPEAAGVAVFAVLAGGAGPGPNATLCLRDVAWGRSGYGVRAGPAAFAVADECVVTPTSTATAAATGTAPLSFTLSGPPTATNAPTSTIGVTKVQTSDNSGLSTAETALLATGLTAFAGVSVMAALLLLWRYRHLLPGSDSGAGPATELKEVKAVGEREDGEQCTLGSSGDEGFFQTGPNPLS